MPILVHDSQWCETAQMAHNGNPVYGIAKEFVPNAFEHTRSDKEAFITFEIVESSTRRFLTPNAVLMQRGNSTLDPARFYDQVDPFNGKLFARMLDVGTNTPPTSSRARALQQRHDQRHVHHGQRGALHGHGLRGLDQTGRHRALRAHTTLDETAGATRRQADAHQKWCAGCRSDSGPHCQTVFYRGAMAPSSRSCSSRPCAAAALRRRLQPGGDAGLPGEAHPRAHGQLRRGQNNQHPELHTGSAFVQLIDGRPTPTSTRPAPGDVAYATTADGKLCVYGVANYLHVRSAPGQRRVLMPDNSSRAAACTRTLWPSACLALTMKATDPRWPRSPTSVAPSDRIFTASEQFEYVRGLCRGGRRRAGPRSARRRAGRQDGQRQEARGRAGRQDQRARLPHARDQPSRRATSRRSSSCTTRSSCRRPRCASCSTPASAGTRRSPAPTPRHHDGARLRHAKLRLQPRRGPQQPSRTVAAIECFGAKPRRSCSSCASTRLQRRRQAAHLPPGVPRYRLCAAGQPGHLGKESLYEATANRPSSSSCTAPSSSAG